MKLYFWLLGWIYAKVMEILGRQKTTWAGSAMSLGQSMALLGNRVKDRLALYRHLLTAGRTGDADVRQAYLLNLGLSALLVGVSYVGWRFLQNHFFPEFDPFLFWDYNGRFWQDIWWVILPAGAYAVFLGLLDLFGSGDEFEDGTLTAENLPFKWLISAGAGVFEELGHRCLYIYYGLISVYLFNRYCSYILFVIILVCAIIVLAFLAGHFSLSRLLPATILLTAIAMWLTTKLPDNYIYRFNGWYLDYLMLFTFKWWLLIPSTVFWMSLALFASNRLRAANEKTRGYRMSGSEFAVRIVAFTAWTAYAMPLGIKAIMNMPILPGQADHLVFCLYVGAILWSNAKFRDGHKYQGPAGLINSYIFGFYMFHLAFTYGLAYAIAVHFAFDALLFTTEHAVEAVKNLDQLRLKSTLRRPFIFLK